jgi:CO/xanthine dehydrogenase Mo-binding subunit
MNDVSTDNKWIGKRTIRPDGEDKVTGRAQYAADYHMPGQIYGKILRSPHAHARILSINVDKALALPGVKAIVTYKDFVQFPIDKPVALGIQDMRWMARNVLAHDKVLFIGHPIAGVAATSASIARQAVKLIEVEYEVLPWAIEIDDALKPDAAILHDWNLFEGKPSNISGKLEHKLGDVEEGFKKADIVIEREFSTRPIHQGYIEPHACVVSVGKDGHTVVWSSSQGQFMVRAMCAHINGLEQSQIRAIPAEIGGGFGGKTIVYLEPVAVALSKKSGRPVKMSMTRDEIFQATGPTSGSKSRVRIGATKDGRIVAAEGTFYLQAGAFPGSPIRGASGCAFAPYDIENVHSVGYDVLCNRSKVAAYRGPGAPIGAHAAELVIDELAARLGIDPIDIRLKNAAKQGTKSAYGAVFPAIGYEATLRAAKEHPHYKTPLGPNQGRGVASGFWFNAGGESSAQVNVNEDGTVVIVTGHPDIGGSRASTANIAAEILGIPYESISVLIGDTSVIGFSNLTGGSRVTFASAIVVTQSTQAVITQLRERAAKIWKIDPDAVIWEDGEARPAGDNAGKFPPLSLKAIAEKASATGGPIGAGTQLNTTGAEGGFATHICDVEVDPETGKTTVLRYTSVQDVGRAIHPSYVEGQMQGGAVQGIGWALNEEYIYDKNGKVDNPGFLDYRMPVASDMPMIDNVILEIPNPKHPQGVRGVGEVPLVASVPATANAVNNAAGIRLNSLPMSPPKVLKAIRDAGKTA